MYEFYGDFHVHIGRTENNKPIKITAARSLNFANIAKECVERKGINIVGIIDCASPYVIEDIENLLATGDVDDILIGNYPASDEELEALSKINFQAIEFRVDEVEGCTDVERGIMYDFAPHWDRFDHSSFMLRSCMPRLQFKETA